MGNDDQPGAQAPTATVGAPVAVPGAVLGPVTGKPSGLGADLVEDPMDWSWPPYAPLEPAGGRRFDCVEWAPSSIVRRPLVRVGRWTLLYRRGR